MTTFAGDELDGVCVELIPFKVVFGGLMEVGSCLKLKDTLGLFVAGAVTDRFT